MLIPAHKLSEECARVYPNGVDPHREYPVNDDGITLQGFTAGNDVEVHKLLEFADLSLKWYIPSLEAVEFFMFIRLALGEEPENDNPPAHYFFIDTILKSPNIEPFYMARGIDIWDFKDESVVLCSREFSKTTLIAYLVLYMAYKGKLGRYGKINYGLYVSDTMENGVKMMFDKIKGIYYESAFLQDRFESASFTQKESIFVRHPESKKDRALFKEYVEKRGMKKEQVPGRMKRTFKMDGKGCGTSSRGASNVLFRPQFVFVDDSVPSEEKSSSTAVLNAIESTIEADIRGGLSGTGYFMVVIGTPYNKRDPVYKRVEEGLMVPIVFPRAKAMPVDEMKQSEFESVWPNRHTYKSCRSEYRDAKKVADKGDGYKMRKLQQEHYLVIAGKEDRLVKDDQIQWYNRTQLEKTLDGYNLYGTTDFTASNTKKGDLSGSALWALSSQGDWFMLDISLRPQGIEEQYDPLFNMIQDYGQLASRTIEVGVETNGQQQIHIPLLKKVMREKNSHFIFARQLGKPYGSQGISRQGGGDKHQHFMRFHSLMERKKIFFPEELKESPDMIELMSELEFVTQTAITSKFDDGCFVAGTQVVLADGTTKNIEDINNDIVMTFGSDSLTSLAYPAIMTSISDVIEYSLSDGTKIICTANHPVLTMTGWREIGLVKTDEPIIRIDTCKLKSSDTSGPKNHQDTISQQQTLMEKDDGCISTHGLKRAGKFNQKDSMFITSTKTKIITIQKILSSSVQAIIPSTMECIQKSVKKEQEKISRRFNRSQGHGINQKKEENGTENTMKKCQEKHCLKNTIESVRTAEKSISLETKVEKCTVAPPVKMLQDALILAITTMNAFAKYVRSHLCGSKKAIHVEAKTACVNTKCDREKIEPKNIRVHSAKKSTTEMEKGMDSARSVVKENIIQKKIECIWKTGAVLSAEKYLAQNEKMADSVGRSVSSTTIISSKQKGKRKVYNFEVKDTHNYILGNGVVVHNCDLMSMLPLMEVVKPMKQGGSRSRRGKNSNRIDSDRYDEPDAGAGY